MGGHQTIDVRLEPAHAGWRLDRALAAAVPTLSRERLKALIRSGAVEARGSAVRDPAIKVSGDEALRRRGAGARRRRTTKPQDIPLTIVFEDEHLLVVDKPAGLVVHPGRGQSRRDAGQCAAAPLRAASCRASAGSRGRASSTASTRTRRGCWSSPRPTSRTKGLAKQFAAHSIDRRYLAIVAGVPKPADGTVDAPLARSAANRKKIAIVEGGRGKRAVTHWKRLQAAARRGAGRMPARNRPDPPGARPHGLDRPSAARRSGLRAVRKDARRAVEELDFHRQALHAAELGFTHPVTKSRLSFSSAMPADMQELFSALGV